MAHYLSIIIEILEQDQHHLVLIDSKNKIESFLEKARSWRDTLLQYSCFTGDKLQNQVIAASYKAADVIETHIRNQVLRVPPSVEPSPRFPDKLSYKSCGFKFVDGDASRLDLTNTVEEFESIIKKLLDEPRRQPLLPQDHLTSNLVPWYPKLDPRCKDDLTSIFQHNFKTLTAQLTEGPSKLRIIAINGMVGMGKRTLSRRLFNDPFIATHFRTRAWVISPFNIDEKGCMLNLLEGLGILTIDMHGKDVQELKGLIHYALKHIKYFIVIYDILNGKNLATFSSLFRDYGVGARVLFTTTEVNDANVSTYAELYNMPLMCDTESWLLLCQKVFGREHCPPELESVGKKIMQLCKGRPVIVSIIAGVLATSEKAPATWELVATTLGTLIDGKENIEGIQLEIFVLIYNHLPNYLRACFIYVGAFFESHDIKASKIIKLWIAEGFVKQNAGECLEDVAGMYLKILIDKNLLFHTHKDPNGEVKAFQPQLFWKVCCWWIAQNEKFLGSKYYHDTWEILEEKLARRVSVHGLSQLCDETELPLLARSLISVSGASRRQVSLYLKLRLLRVLEVFQLEFYQFPMEIMQQVLLRYLAFSCHSNISISFSVLCNLQTLIIHRRPAFRAFSVPSDLWELTQLRHVKCKETFLLIYPRNGIEVVHRNLQTLSNMQLLGVTCQFLKQIPNIRNLGIFSNIAMETPFDLACLDKLETLKCSSDWSLASRNFLAHLTLPQSIRKLNMCLCRISLKFMEVVGSLPNLEILKLQKSDFIGASTWETTEGEFSRLVSLEMLDLNLIHWRAKATHLPRLKHLVVHRCYAMAEIPLDIGNIRTLELIQVNETSPSALVSAMQIKKEQQGHGNKILQVRTHMVV